MCDICKCGKKLASYADLPKKTQNQIKRHLVKQRSISWANKEALEIALDDYTENTCFCPDYDYTDNHGLCEDCS